MRNFFRNMAMRGFLGSAGDPGGSGGGADNVCETQLVGLIDRTATEITVPDSVAEIGAYAFYGCSRLSDIYLHSGIKNIGTRAFNTCTSLREISLPLSLESIGDYAFTGAGLYSVSLPAGVTIKKRAFASCSSLESVTFEGRPASITSDVFYDSNNLTIINVPWAEGAVANAPWLSIFPILGKILLERKIVGLFISNSPNVSGMAMFASLPLRNTVIVSAAHIWRIIFTLLILSRYSS